MANWSSVINIASSDSRFLLWLNELLYRLLNAGIYVGSTQRYRVCVSDGYVTWPRQIQAIYAMEVCDQPITLRNGWFEFLDNGPGMQHTGDGCYAAGAFDRGSQVCMFDDITVPSRIRLYRSYAADATKAVTIRGFDSGGNEVFTNNGATVGERMVLSSSYVDSDTIWMPQSFREAIKDVTTGYVRAYSWDATLPTPPASPGATDTPLKALAVWEPSETLPNYRRTLIPQLSGRGNGCTSCTGETVSDETCTPKAVTVVAKIAFIPVASDLDFLWTSNFPALKMGMIALMKEERGDIVGAQAAWNGTFDPIRRKFINGCIPLLEDELEAFNGPGVVSPVRLVNSAVGGAYVENLI